MGNMITDIPQNQGLPEVDLMRPDESCVTGDIVRIVAHVVTADILFFNPDGTYLELI